MSRGLMCLLIVIERDIINGVWKTI